VMPQISAHHESCRRPAGVGSRHWRRLRSGYFAIGVQAYTSSISNIAPKVSLQLGSGSARDFTRLDQLMRRYVHPLYALRERMRGYGSPS